MDETSSGRIYDATLGRFLQADPHIDGATQVGGFNRYAYVKNNPLNAMDPSGYGILSKVWKKLRPFVGMIATIGLNIFAPGLGLALGSLIGNLIGTLANGGSLKDFAKGALENMILDMVPGGKLGRVAASAALSRSKGQHFLRSFVAAGISSMGSADSGSDFSAYALFESAMLRGLATEATGGKFKNGAAEGSMEYLIKLGGKKLQGAIEGRAAKAGQAYGSGEPEDARQKYSATRGDLDLQVVDGVLTGEVDVGCKNSVNCSQAFEALESINQVEGVNIKFNRHTVFADSRDLDFEITFSRDGTTQYFDSEAKTLFNPRKGGRMVLDREFFGNNINTTRWRQVAVLHELGHAMGHVHMVNSTNSIMSYSATTNKNFTHNEINAIKRAYQ